MSDHVYPAAQHAIDAAAAEALRVDANQVHIAAMALHCALMDAARREGISDTAFGHGWDPAGREGFVDMPSTQLAEALLRAGWTFPPPPLG